MCRNFNIKSRAKEKQNITLEENWVTHCLNIYWGMVYFLTFLLCFVYLKRLKKMPPQFPEHATARYSLLFLLLNKLFRVKNHNDYKIEL